VATGAASHLLVTARSFDARAPFCRGTAGQCKLYLVGSSHTQHAKVCVCMPKPVDVMLDWCLRPPCLHAHQIGRVILQGQQLSSQPRFYQYLLKLTVQHNCDIEDDEAKATLVKYADKQETWVDGARCARKSAITANWPSLLDQYRHRCI
jgi:hypothetical protein